MKPQRSLQQTNRSPQSTAPAMARGTTSYMSPEQARGLVVDARTGIFSLGVVRYEMIADRAPFGGVNAIEVMGAMLDQEPAPLPSHVTTRLAEAGAAGELERIIKKARHKGRNQRYQASNDLLLDLQLKLRGQSGARSNLRGVRHIWFIRAQPHTTNATPCPNWRPLCSRLSAANRVQGL